MVDGSTPGMTRPTPLAFVGEGLCLLLPQLTRGDTENVLLAWEWVFEANTLPYMGWT